MPNRAFPAILWGMKTMSYNNALTIYQDSIGLHPDLKVFVRSDGAVWHPCKLTHRTKWEWSFGYEDPYGYLMTWLDGVRFFVHRIVAETFIPNPNGKDYVDHINRLRSDNRVENLRWVTREENETNKKRADDCLTKYGVRAIHTDKVSRKEYMKRWRAEKSKDPEWLRKNAERSKRNYYEKKGQPHG